MHPKNVVFSSHEDNQSRLFIAFAIVMIGCGLSWGIGGYLCWFNLRTISSVLPELLSVSLSQRLVGYGSALVLWGGVGFSIGAGVGLVQAKLRRKLLVQLTLLWSISGFVWWRFSLLGYPILVELRSLGIDTTYIQLGSIVAALCTVLLLRRDNIQYTLKQGATLFVLIFLARYLAGIFETTFLPNSTPIPLNAFWLNTAQGLLYGFLLGLGVIATIPTEQRPSFAKNRINEVLSPKPHIQMLAKRLPAPSKKLVYTLLCLSISVGLILSLWILVAQPLIALEINRDVRTTWSPEKPTNYFVLLCSAFILLNTVFAWMRFPSFKEREIIRLANISYSDETFAYVLRGLWSSLPLLSLVPGILLITTSIMLTGDKVVWLMRRLSSFDGLWISVVMAVQAFVLIALLQLVCLLILDLVLKS